MLEEFRLADVYVRVELIYHQNNISQREPLGNRVCILPITILFCLRKLTCGWRVTTHLAAIDNNQLAIDD